MTFSVDPHSTVSTFKTSREANSLVVLKEYKFKSLHKFMRPFYAQLNWSTEVSIEKKKMLCEEFFLEFYQRVRRYRGLTLQDLAVKMKVSVPTLEDFERGCRDHQKEISDGYLKVCGAHQELDFFLQKLNEFQHPFIKDVNPFLSPITLRKLGFPFKKEPSLERGRVISFLKKTT